MKAIEIIRPYRVLFSLYTSIIFLIILGLTKKADTETLLFLFFLTFFTAVFLLYVKYNYNKKKIIKYLKSKQQFMQQSPPKPKPIPITIDIRKELYSATGNIYKLSKQDILQIEKILDEKLLKKGEIR